MHNSSPLQTLRNIMRLYDIIAKEFSATRSRPWNYIIEYARKMQPQSIIADLGCGNGRHTLPYAQMGHYVIALDISRKMLSITKSKLLKNKILYNADMIQASITHLPLRQNIFNLVMCIATLHHVPTRIDRILALNEMHKILKDNSLLIISVWNLLQLHHMKNIIKTFMFTRRLTLRDVYVPWKHKGLILLRYYHLYTKRELISDFRYANIRKPKIYRLDIKPTILPQNLLAIAKKTHH